MINSPCSTFISPKASGTERSGFLFLILTANSTTAHRHTDLPIKLLGLQGKKTNKSIELHTNESMQCVDHAEFPTVITYEKDSFEDEVQSTEAGNKSQLLVCGYHPKVRQLIAFFSQSLCVGTRHH